MEEIQGTENYYNNAVQRDTGRTSGSNYWSPARKLSCSDDEEGEGEKLLDEELNVCKE